jgi:hypothetical protein
MRALVKLRGSNMFRNSAISAFLISISMSTFAAECPSPSDWSHQKGKQWVLSQQAIQEGWQVSRNSAINSDFTTIPSQAMLYTRLQPASTECIYYLDPIGYNMAIAYSLTKLADYTSISQPPFVGDNKNGYHCKTNASSATVCQWKWKN